MIEISQPEMVHLSWVVTNIEGNDAFNIALLWGCSYWKSIEIVDLPIEHGDFT